MNAGVGNAIQRHPAGQAQRVTVGAVAQPADQLEQHVLDDALHADLACSVQRVVEDVLLELVGWLRDRTDGDALCLAGCTHTRSKPPSA
ncbi:hypothetical protein MAHJHV57_47680 [Mycobacterium avium subsp. hominissuis]